MSEPTFEAPSLETLAALLPGYDIEAFVAEGGMGAVYKGRQRSLERDVAIKILPRELGGDPDFRRSFETEARAMARLNHPNLVSVFDFGDVGGLLYIVMEFVRGKSLFHSAHNRAVDPVQAVEIVAGICRGLAHAHDNGIIHRDVKPANILLTPKREPKLGDFGLARQAGPESQGLAMGTPGYTAPEVTRDPDHADRRSDIFSAGVILYELLTGRSPEPGCQPPSKIAGSDPALDKVWQTATRPDPADRYPSAAAMASALEMWRQGSAEPGRPRRRKRKMPGATTNWSLARNLAIIAMLIVAIAITWREYQRVQADRVAASQSSTPPQPAPTPAPTEPTPSKPAPPVAIAPDPVVAEPPLPAPAESPAQSLVRLREKLAAGERDEMPVGTLSRGGSHFFLVTFPMTWADAERFADSFGGHLAIIKSAADLEWLATRIPDTTDTKRSRHWISARHSSGQGWQSADASPWPLKIMPQGKGEFAAVQADGRVIAENDRASHPFLIQWQSDGTNPARLREILRRTKASLIGSSPVFPHGTLIEGDRHVLIARDSVTAAQARELAELGGGELYVPSNPAEADWIASQVDGISAPAGLWMGASREGREWKWHTGEPWTFARWSSGFPSGQGTALVLVPGKGWQDADPAETAAGFIIEWSDAAPPAATPRESDALAELRAKAGGMLADLDRQRQQDLAKNAKAFAWELDVWLRSNSKGDILRWKPGVERLKDGVRGNRVPSGLPKKPSPSFPERMLKIAGDALAREQGIDETFTAKAAALRDAYVERLAALRDAEFERGQIELARELAATIEGAADTKRWAESFEGVIAKIDTSLPLVTIVSATYGTRGKFADVTARVTRFVEEERRDFRANPGDLGVDPDPGWNKGLTIVYEIDGEKHSKSWGENSEVKLSMFDGK